MAYNPLQVLVQTNGDINFLIEHDGSMIELYEITMAQTANAHPSPFGRTFTSTTRTENDVLRVQGIIREQKCGFLLGSETPASKYLVELKSQIEEQKYTPDSLCQITLPKGEGIMSNMRISRVTWSRERTLEQQIKVDMEFIAMDFAGTPDTYTYEKAGVGVPPA